ncbi:TetR family transcriptional regulator C-terminal domain-containing protein [Streptomyces formicae]|uniref:BetI-type transcriptional repressor C-terminal domain-containing protein n=1 Tax=Streptomyces formicae TaxID=1616117 RepID=A0A291QIW4_9ACTN|nr:TetR family transcriptional regulator C-terminal domain-containing protein [Streptomyces formicae]ATL31385.1 hypothetical protein KY5_6367 [Streptomyces formicae]
MDATATPGPAKALEPHPRKRHLPFPYDQDLSPVLRHLNRRTAAGRRRLANDPHTAAYLAAGMRLVEQHLGPGAARATSVRGRYRVERAVLAFLSQRAVAGEVANNPSVFPRRGVVSTLRTQWRTQSDYVADLINFAMWPVNYRPGYVERRAVDTERLVTGDDFVRTVHETAYRHTAEGARTPSVRLSLALMAVADGDDTVQRALADTYRGYLSSWKELYADVIEARNLRLRPGLTLDDLANALSAATDGIILRSIGDPGSGVLDHDRCRSLMGTVSLALIHGFLEPADDAGEGLTLEQAVEARTGIRRGVRPDGAG